MQADYSDTLLRSKIYDLYDTSFARLSERIHIADGLGAHWHEVSTAFIALEDGIVAAHTGVIGIPLVVNGERRLVAGVHAVCTRPELRGRGLARQTLLEALAFVDGNRFDAAILTTSIPAMYEPYGFRVIPEVIAEYRGALPPRKVPARNLDAGRAEDLEVLQRLLERRAPVSQVLSSVDPGWLFIIDEVLASWRIERVYYSEQLDTALVLECEAGTLKVLDIVGPAVPDVDAVLSAVPMEFERAEFHFVPDRLGDGAFRVRPADPRDRLMVRGALPLASEVMLSPLARC